MAHRSGLSEGEVSYPFWAIPIPKFITNQGGTTPADLSDVASLPLAVTPSIPAARWASIREQMVRSSRQEATSRLPNGLQGYVLFGAWNQRRVDAFTNIVRDPRILRNVGDKMLDNLSGFGRTAGVEDHRLNTASSCIGCHVDGMNRGNNDLRDWLDEGGSRLPKGESGGRWSDK